MSDKISTPFYSNSTQQAFLIQGKGREGNLPFSRLRAVEIRSKTLKVKLGSVIVVTMPLARGTKYDVYTVEDQTTPCTDFRSYLVHGVPNVNSLEYFTRDVLSRLALQELKRKGMQNVSSKHVLKLLQDYGLVDPSLS